VSPPQGAGVQIYNSSSGCRAHSALHGGWDRLTPLSFRFPDPTLGKGDGFGVENDEALLPLSLLVNFTLLQFKKGCQWVWRPGPVDPAPQEAEEGGYLSPRV
jgi:hypothetical protein